MEIEGKKSGDLFGFFETSPHFHFSYGGMLESFVIVVICLIGWILDLPVQLVNAFLDFRHGVAPCLIIQLYRFFAANGTDRHNSEYNHAGQGFSENNPNCC